VDDWKQDHFYGMKSFFSRMYENGGFVGERDYGLVKFRTTANEDKTARLMFLSGAVVEEPEVPEPSDEEKKKEKQRLEELKKNKQAPPPPAFSRRAQLVKVALQPGEDRFLARSIVNRVWQRLFGHGLVMPLDQMHSENPPSHPELLDWLARDLAANSYDLRRLVRGLVLSQAYSRSSYWEGNERPRADLIAVASLRPLTPQQYAASLKVASADHDSFPADMKPEEFEKQMEAIDNSARAFAGEIEMPGDDFQIGVNEALLFSNGERVVKEFLSEGKGRLVTRLAEIVEVDELVDSAVWSVLGRPADSEELQILGQYVSARQDRRVQACQQIVWALVTGAEFRFNY
jgi:hypothetical protein